MIYDARGAIYRVRIIISQASGVDLHGAAQNHRGRFMTPRMKLKVREQTLFAACASPRELAANN